MVANLDQRKRRPLGYSDEMGQSAFANRVRRVLRKHEPLMLEILGVPPPKFVLMLGDEKQHAAHMRYTRENGQPQDWIADEPSMSSLFDMEAFDINRNAFVRPLRFSHLVIWENVWTRPAPAEPIRRAKIGLKEGFKVDEEGVLQQRFAEFDDIHLALGLFHELVHHHLAARGLPPGHDKTLYAIWYRFLCALRVPEPIHMYFEQKDREYNGLPSNRSRQVWRNWIAKLIRQET